ncbi:hypothetical protein [Mycobacterium vicinigordonae]|uniref:Mce protein n=1 Tax=Mycobacterium vicinigordonae TaxID=1719132 RepID=A0A7D6DW52_9MYCO|nr:hypothetical protein [Mycobacterium vicinigordonae]QLL06247.1 hypothetical protein H0P51_21160 [Mycobacterium vicinigordonae]
MSTQHKVRGDATKPESMQAPEADAAEDADGHRSGSDTLVVKNDNSRESSTTQDEPVTESEDPVITEASEPDTSNPPRRRAGKSWMRMVGLTVLPIIAILLTLAAGYLKWQDGVARESDAARRQSVQAATESTIAMLTYQPDSVDKDLKAAGDRLTGKFRDSYRSLVDDVVIPGAREKKVTSVATVRAAAAVSATPNHAVTLVFVNQTIIIGNDAPTTTSSSVRVTLDKVGSRWLISDFTPI